MEDKVKRYLERIEYSGGTEPTLENLLALQKAHFTHVPYENLDIYYGHEFTLAVEEVYDKIVNRRRGGYCFELNGLYGWLLKQLGYRTEEYFGRWLFGEPLTVPLRRHRVIKVFLPEGEFISDVGIGCQAPLVPFKCVLDETQELSGRMYRIVADPVHGKIIQVVNGAVSRNYFSFDEAPQQSIDFMYAHYWCAHHDPARTERVIGGRDVQKNVPVRKGTASGRLVDVFRNPLRSGGYFALKRSSRKYVPLRSSFFASVWI